MAAIESINVIQTFLINAGPRVFQKDLLAKIDFIVFFLLDLVTLFLKMMGVFFRPLVTFCCYGNEKT